MLEGESLAEDIPEAIVEESGDEDGEIQLVYNNQAYLVWYDRWSHEQPEDLRWSRFIGALVEDSVRLGIEIGLNRAQKGK